MIRIVTSITLATGGLAAAAYAAMGVAAADPDATTISVPDPFGVTFVDPPDFTYQNGDASESIAYGQQLIDFDSANFGSSVDQFLTSSNVLVDGQPLSSTNEFTSQVTADIIDKLQSNGQSEQQILLPAIQGTNIESGVIGIHNLGDGYAYEYIDLVGPGTTSANSDGVDNAVGAFLVTPTGTYDVSPWEDGGDYGGQAYLESQEFDLSNPLPDPFGSLEGSPDITYQTGDVFANTAYGSQTFQFDVNDFPSYVQQFFTSNDVSTAELAAPLTANIIDNVQYNGLFDGLSEQQISLPSIGGVIDIENLGNGYSFDYIDLNNTDIGAWLVTPEGAYDMSSLGAMASLMFDFPSATAAAPFDFLF